MVKSGLQSNSTSLCHSGSRRWQFGSSWNQLKTADSTVDVSWEKKASIQAFLGTAIPLSFPAVWQWNQVNTAVNTPHYQIDTDQSKDKKIIATHFHFSMSFARFKWLSASRSKTTNTNRLRNIHNDLYSIVEAGPGPVAFLYGTTVR